MCLCICFPIFWFYTIRKTLSILYQYSSEWIVGGNLKKKGQISKGISPVCLASFYQFVKNLLNLHCWHLACFIQVYSWALWQVQEILWTCFSWFFSITKLGSTHGKSNRCAYSFTKILTTQAYVFLKNVSFPFALALHLSITMDTLDTYTWKSSGTFHRGLCWHMTHDQTH